MTAARKMPVQTVYQRLWAKVDRDAGPVHPIHGRCWIWAGATSSGYGTISVRIEGKRYTKQAHRVAWEEENGPFPPGRFGCHHCDNPLCVRPSHVFPGTQQQNLDDCRAKGRLLLGEKNPEARLTEGQVRVIRSENAGGMSCAALARRFGLKRESVRDIVKRKNWAHVV